MPRPRIHWKKCRRLLLVSSLHRKRTVAADHATGQHWSHGQSHGLTARTVSHGLTARTMPGVS